MRGLGRYGWDYFLSGIEVFRSDEGLVAQERGPRAAVHGLDEATAYLGHPLLGTRLRECVDAIFPWSGRLGAEVIFGATDALKLRSSLTLFDHVEANGRFAAGLAAFFDGEPDRRTLALLNAPL